MYFDLYFCSVVMCMNSLFMGTMKMTKMSNYTYILHYYDYTIFTSRDLEAGLRCQVLICFSFCCELYI